MGTAASQPTHFQYCQDCAMNQWCLLSCSLPWKWLVFPGTNPVLHISVCGNCGSPHASESCSGATGRAKCSSSGELAPRVLFGGQHSGLVYRTANWGCAWRQAVDQHQFVLSTIFRSFKLLVGLLKQLCHRYSSLLHSLNLCYCTLIAATSPSPCALVACDFCRSIVTSRNEGVAHCKLHSCVGLAIQLADV